MDAENAVVEELVAPLVWPTRRLVERLTTPLV